MRLKRISAPSVAQAIAEIRRTLGAESVIVQIIEPEAPGGLYHVVAAFEPQREQGADTAPLSTIRPVAVDEPVLLIGLPGVGKTLNAVRLAARAKASGRACEILTFDGDAAGSMAQLHGFCDPLDIAVRAVTLATLPSPSPDVMRIIDTPGFNPYDATDVTQLAHMVAQCAVVPIWVQGAGAATVEMTPLVHICQAFGVTRYILTRLDLIHASASLSAQLSQLPFALAAAANSPFVGAPLLDTDALELLLGGTDNAVPWSPRKVA